VPGSSYRPVKSKPWHATGAAWSSGRAVVWAVYVAMHTYAEVVHANGRSCVADAQQELCASVSFATLAGEVDESLPVIGGKGERTRSKRDTI